MLKNRWTFSKWALFRKQFSRCIHSRMSNCGMKFGTKVASPRSTACCIICFTPASANTNGCKCKWKSVNKPNVGYSEQSFNVYTADVGVKHLIHMAHSAVDAMHCVMNGFYFENVLPANYLRPNYFCRPTIPSWLHNQLTRRYASAHLFPFWAYSAIIIWWLDWKN